MLGSTIWPQVPQSRTRVPSGTGGGGAITCTTDVTSVPRRRTTRADGRSAPKSRTVTTEPSWVISRVPSSVGVTSSEASRLSVQETASAAGAAGDASAAGAAGASAAGAV